jgi:hypothetical protein
MQKEELSTGLTFDRLKARDPTVIKKHCRVFALERFYHVVIVLRIA